MGCAESGGTAAFDRAGTWGIDYRPIFEAAKKTRVKHVFVEQEEFDMAPVEALRIDAEYMKALKV
jgi:hypothetical protein